MSGFESVLSAMGQREKWICGLSIKTLTQMISRFSASCTVRACKNNNWSIGDPLPQNVAISRPHRGATVEVRPTQIYGTTT